MKRSQLPPIISKLRKAIGSMPLPSPVVVKVFDNPSRLRKMRAERRKTLAAVLNCLIRHYDLATGLLVQFESRTVAETLTVSQIMRETRLSESTIHRILAWLKSIKFLSSEEQEIRVFIGRNGEKQLAASSIFRHLEDSFFAAMGFLGELLAERKGKLNQIVYVRKREVRVVISKTTNSVSEHPKEYERPSLTPEQERDRAMLQRIVNSRLQTV